MACRAVACAASEGWWANQHKSGHWILIISMIREKASSVAKSGHSAHDPRAWANIVQNRAWWITLLQWTLWGVLMLIIAGWLGKSRFRARPASEARRLVHAPSTLIIGLICFAFFAGLAIDSNVVRNQTTTWWTTAVFTGFARCRCQWYPGFSWKNTRFRKTPFPAEILRESENIFDGPTCEPCATHP